MIAETYGDVWLEISGQSLIWAFLMFEIPKQITQHNIETEAGLRHRLEELEDNEPDDEEIPRLRARIERGALRCEVEVPAKHSDQCIIASVFKSLWPLEEERRIQFALCSQGFLRIRSLGTIDKMPAVVTRARDAVHAQERAQSLARAAIQLVHGGERPTMDPGIV